MEEEEESERGGENLQGSPFPYLKKREGETKKQSETESSHSKNRGKERRKTE